MIAYFKQNIRLLITLFFTVLTLSCSKDEDLLAEIARYEESIEAPTPEVDSNELPETEESTEETEETEETEATGATEEQNNSGHPRTGAFYVTPNGSSSNDGSSESSAWSIGHALNNAKPGDVLYVKSGVYNVGSGITTSISGSPNAPIVIMGYKDSPGDIIANQGSIYKYPDIPSSDDMPMIKGADSQTGWGITWNGQGYVELHNLIIEDFAVGMTWNLDNGIIDNVVFHQMGRQDGPRSGNGNGARINGQYNEIRNCYFVNNGSVALSLNNSFNEVDYCQVVGDNNMRPTGYFIICSGDQADNNIIQNCDIQRLTSDSGHQGHGYIAKNGAENNVFRNSIALNTGIEASYKNSRNNTWEDITIKSDTDRFPSTYSAGIRIMNGSNNNIFKDIYVENNLSGIEFRDYDDGSSSDYSRDATEGGSQNKFINVIVHNVERGIWFSDGEGGSNTSFSNDNQFIHCTFYNVDTFLSVAQNVSGLIIQNSIIDRVKNRIISTSGGNFDYSFDSTNFSNTSSAVPGGKNISTFAPSFNNVSAGDFRLTNATLDIGVEIPEALAENDFLGKPRILPYTLGALER